MKKLSVASWVDFASFVAVAFGAGLMFTLDNVWATFWAMYAAVQILRVIGERGEA